MKKSSLFTLIVLGAVTLGSVACDSKKSDTEKSADQKEPLAKAEADAAESAEATTAAKTFVPPEGWEIVDHQNPDASVKELLDPARKAQGHLGIRLIGELSQAVKSQGAAEAVTVCNTSVSGIRQGVEAEFKVNVGRTSHKVRNPDNAPPDFMKPIVEARYDKPVAMKGPAGQVVWSFPLRLGPLCANCHGTEDKIAPGVNEKVAELYPKDQATGFEVGELRGWIWAESTPDT